MHPLLHVTRHPLVLHKLAWLRDRTTEPQTFRRLVREISQLLFYEATQDLRQEERIVETPLAECQGLQIADTVGLVPILRAGLGMVEPILDMLPKTQVWHVGVYRDHQTLKPVTYYQKLPPKPQFDLAIVIDPMLATGGSAIAAVDILKQWGLERIKFLGIMAAPEGIETLRAVHPDVPIYLAAIDSHLNERGYIVPGLGDAGDRQFGTC
jgi:uracil phosphoribosyltransferase